MTKVRFLFATCQAPLSQPTDTFFSPKQTWGACSTRRLLPVCNIILLGSRGPKEEGVSGNRGLPLGLHNLQVLADAVGSPPAGSRASLAGLPGGWPAGEVSTPLAGRSPVCLGRRRSEPAQSGRLGAALSGQHTFASHPDPGAVGSPPAGGSQAAAIFVGGPVRSPGGGWHSLTLPPPVERAQPGVLRVAVGVRPNGTFQVLEWRAAPAETTEAYVELFTRLWQRGADRNHRNQSSKGPSPRELQAQARRPSRYSQNRCPRRTSGRQGRIAFPSFGRTAFAACRGSEPSRDSRPSAPFGPSLLKG